MITVTYGPAETHVLCECGHVEVLPPTTSACDLSFAMGVSAAGRTCNGCGRMQAERRRFARELIDQRAKALAEWAP